MTDEEMIEQVARAIDPAAWEVGQPIPTREAVVAYHSARQASIAKARAILPIIKAERIRGGEMVKEAALAKLDEDGSEIEAALTSEGIYVWGPDGERFERMFDVVMIGRRALSVPAIVEAGDGDL